jgi:hypothetical protein
MMIREARLPFWALTAERGVISSQYAIRLWELAERELQDPDIAVAFAQHYRRGELSLFDYLFATAPSLAAGYKANIEFLHLVTNNSRVRIIAETDRDVTYAYEGVPSSPAHTPSQPWAASPASSAMPTCGPPGGPCGAGPLLCPTHRRPLVR